MRRSTLQGKDSVQAPFHQRQTKRGEGRGQEARTILGQGDLESRQAALDDSLFERKKRGREKIAFDTSKRKRASRSSPSISSHQDEEREGGVKKASFRWGGGEGKHALTPQSQCRAFWGEERRQGKAYPHLF